jgi:DNA-binding FrmR family transcriptional regulator
MKKGSRICHSEKTLINLKKARSHLDKVIHMKENEVYCIDIIQQNLAIIGLLKSANQALMEGHLNTCFANAIKAKDTKKQADMVAEILRVASISSK